MRISFRNLNTLDAKGGLACPRQRRILPCLPWGNAQARWKLMVRGPSRPPARAGSAHASPTKLFSTSCQLLANRTAEPLHLEHAVGGRIGWPAHLSAPTSGRAPQTMARNGER